MNRRIEKMIPVALEKIEEYFTENNEISPIPRTFQGSISSMGASILQMGLLPTLAVFADKESGAVDDQRSKILEILKRILSDFSDYEEPLLDQHPNQNLFTIAAKEMSSNEQRKQLEVNLLDAAVAMKLCLRTFKLEEA